MDCISIGPAHELISHLRQLRSSVLRARERRRVFVPQARPFSSRMRAPHLARSPRHRLAIGSLNHWLAERVASKWLFGLLSGPRRAGSRRALVGLSSGCPRARTRTRALAKCHLPAGRAAHLSGPSRWDNPRRHAVRARSPPAGVSRLPARWFAARRIQIK